jgi:hypothetical protein
VRNFAVGILTQRGAIYTLKSLGGALAQLVEQGTENPCVPSSILGGATILPFSRISITYRVCRGSVYLPEVVNVHGARFSYHAGHTGDLTNMSSTNAFLQIM